MEGFDRTTVVNRVKRAQGQLAGVLRMLEQERDVAAVLHQIKAVASALERAGLTLAVAEWRALAEIDGELSIEQLDDVEQLFLSLK